MISLLTINITNHKSVVSIRGQLQDLSEVLPMRFSQRGCLGLCGQGPNCLLETQKGNQAVNRLDSFSKVMAMLKKFAKNQGATCGWNRQWGWILVDH